MQWKRSGIYTTNFGYIWFTLKQTSINSAWFVNTHTPLENGLSLLHMQNQMKVCLIYGHREHFSDITGQCKLETSKCPRCKHMCPLFKLRVCCKLFTKICQMKKVQRKAESQSCTDEAEILSSSARVYSKPQWQVVWGIRLKKKKCVWLCFTFSALEPNSSNHPKRSVLDFIQFNSATLFKTQRRSQCQVYTEGNGGMRRCRNNILKAKMSLSHIRCHTSTPSTTLSMNGVRMWRKTWVQTHVTLRSKSLEWT